MICFLFGGFFKFQLDHKRTSYRHKMRSSLIDRTIHSAPSFFCFCFFQLVARAELVSYSFFTKLSYFRTSKLLNFHTSKRQYLSSQNPAASCRRQIFQTFIPSCFHTSKLSYFQTFIPSNFQIFTFRLPNFRTIIHSYLQTSKLSFPDFQMKSLVSESRNFILQITDLSDLHTSKQKKHLSSQNLSASCCRFHPSEISRSRIVVALLCSPECTFFFKSTICYIHPSSFIIHHS